MRSRYSSCSQAEGVVALAKVDGELAGFAEVSIRHDHVDGTSAAPVPYLEGWYVEENFRGKGVGRELVRFVEEWARERGFVELASDAELWNEESIRLHGTLGFREVGRTVHFVKELNPPRMDTQGQE
jgi:aminoglycoside 6'-N-acetyltransferase I